MFLVCSTDFGGLRLQTLKIGHCFQHSLCVRTSRKNDVGMPTCPSLTRLHTYLYTYIDKSIYIGRYIRGNPDTYIHIYATPIKSEPEVLSHSIYLAVYMYIYLAPARLAKMMWACPGAPPRGVFLFHAQTAQVDRIYMYTHIYIHTHIYICI